MTHSEVLDNFKSYLIARGESLIYVERINPFLNWVASNNLDFTVFGFMDFNKYMVYRKAKGLKANTLNLDIFSLKSFYNFLYNINMINENVLGEVGKLKRLRVSEEIRPFLTMSEFKELMYRTITILRMHPTKLKAILYFMFYTGVRKSEILNLKRKDVDLKLLRAIIRLPVKNKKEKVVLFTEPVAQCIASYFRMEPEVTNAFNLTKAKLRYIFTRMTELMPSDIKITPHMMRRSFANFLDNKGFGIKDIQILMGHARPQTTLLYIHPTLQSVERIYREKLNEKTCE